MARRVGLPSPSTSPFGSGGGAFGAYDVLSSGRSDNIEWQKAQAAWAAGKISNAAYLGQWQAYIDKLDVGSSTYVNAVQGLRQQKYVFARDDIVTRIEQADPKSNRYVDAWTDLLEFDQRAMSGMVSGNEELRQRADRLRATQNGLFQVGYDKMAKRYADKRITTRQVREWYQRQLDTALVDGNAPLRRTILDSIADLRGREQTEARDEVYKRWAADEMPPEEFLSFAATQLSVLPDGSEEEEKWRTYIQQARIEIRTASMEYRWGLSQRYRELQGWLAQPNAAPGSKTTGTRTILRNGQWVEVPISEAPSASDVASYQQREVDKAEWKAEMERIEQRIGATGDQFVTPDEMLRFYQKQIKKYAPGTDSFFAVQAQIDRYEDMKALWDAQDSISGTIFSTPTVEPAAPTGDPDRVGGGALPGEKGLSIEKFMRSLGMAESGGNYRAVNSESGARGKYQIMPANWPSWAKTYLGDANAKWTPENQEAVAKGKLMDLHKWLGSWARVAYWWLTGDGKTTDTGQWSTMATGYVNKVITGAGLASMPDEYDFSATKPRTARAPVPDGVYTGQPREGWGGRTDIGGGANLTDASAGASAYGVVLTDRNSSWWDVVRALKNGKGMVAQGYAMVFQGSGQGSERYDPNYVTKGLGTDHSVMIWGYRTKNGRDQILWLDPLAEDGHEGHWVDASLVRRFMTTFTGTSSRVAVAIGQGRIRVPPTVVTEREPGPWTGCTWGSTAMLINGLKGRRVASMADVRAYGESGQYQPADQFTVRRGMADNAGRQQDGSAPNQQDKQKGGPKVGVSVVDGQPVVPGPGPRREPDMSLVGGVPTGDPGAPGGGWTWPIAVTGNPTAEDPRGNTGTVKLAPGEKTNRKPDFYTVETLPFPGYETVIRPGRLKNGMGPGAFNDFYAAYRTAFANGLSTFVYTDDTGRTRNYYVGEDPLTRRTVMENLDTRRIDLTVHQWRKAANDPSADPDKVSERRRAYDDAVSDAAQNAFDAMVMGQTGEDVPGQANANPAADIQRVVSQVSSAVAEHYALAKKRWESGDETGAWAEIQAAQELIDRAEEPLNGLVGQVQGTIAAWEKEGQAPDKETGKVLADAVDWYGTSGLADQDKDAEKLLGDISSVIKLGPDGKPVVNPADGQMVLQEDVFRIIKPSTDPGSDDRIEYERGKMALQRNGDGELVPGYELPDHVNTKVYVNGRWIAAQAPWTPTVVGQIIDGAGNRYDLIGKQISARINGESFNQFEQPLAPGRWSTSPVIYRAPETFEVTYDTSGAATYSWVANDAEGKPTRYSIGFDPTTASYNLYQQHKEGVLGDVWGAPVGVGPLAGNPAIQEAMAWDRDMTGLDAVGRFGADLEGGTLGMSASVLLTTQQLDSRRKNMLRQFGAIQQKAAQDAATAAQTSIWTRTQPGVAPTTGGLKPGDPFYIAPVSPQSFDAMIAAQRAREGAVTTEPTRPGPTPAPSTPPNQRPGWTRPTPTPTPTTQPTTSTTVTPREPDRREKDDVYTPPAPKPQPKPKEPDVIVPRVPRGGGGPVIS